MSRDAALHWMIRPAAAACRRIEPTLRVCDEGADCHCSLSCSLLAAIAVDLEQDSRLEETDETDSALPFLALLENLVSSNPVFEDSMIYTF